MTRFVVAVPWWLWLPGALLYALVWIYAIFFAIILLALCLIVYVVGVFIKNFKEQRREP